MGKGKTSHEILMKTFLKFWVVEDFLELNMMRKKNERLLGFQWGGTIVVTIECYLKCFNSLNQLEKSDETKNLLKNQNVKALTTGKTHFGDAVCKLLE